jgi:hypothetical protein
MHALSEALADPLSHGEPDATDLLALRRADDPTENALLADAMARSLRSALDRTVRPLARAARRFVHERCWVPFGYARLEDHARERFGRTARWVRDLSALDTGLEKLPRLGPALGGDDGGRPIGRVAALFIAKVATPESLPIWIELARKTTVRDLKARVRRARKRGSAWPEETEDEICASDTDEVTRGETTEADEDAAAEPCCLRMPAPSPVRMAYYETSALHRSVVGSEASPASFADALVAEAWAGPHPPDIEVASPAAGGSTAGIERRLAAETNRWEHLDRSGARSPALAIADACLRRVEELIGRAGHGGPRDLDEQIRDLIVVEDDAEKALARLLLEMGEQGAWRRLGFAGVGHYAEERLKLSRSSAGDRVRLARALRRLCGVREAYEAGSITVEAARLVARTLGRGGVDPALEQRWIERAEQATVKRLRDEMRALRRRRSTEGARVVCDPLDDSDWHASLCQEPGVFRDQVRALGRRAAEDPSIDGWLGLTLRSELAGRFLAAVEASRAAVAATVAQEPGDEVDPHPDEPASIAIARAFSARRQPVPAWVGLLAMLEDFVETWDDPRAHPKRSSDAVYIRDGWRCSAPGCTSRRNLEDHHLVYRSRGGGDGMENRTSLCRFHHQMGEHGTVASCRGTAPLGIEWRLGSMRVTRYRNELRIGGERVRDPSRLRPEERAASPECRSQSVVPLAFSSRSEEKHHEP